MFVSFVCICLVVSDLSCCWLVMIVSWLLFLLRVFEVLLFGLLCLDACVVDLGLGLLVTSGGCFMIGGLYVVLIVYCYIISGWFGLRCFAFILVGVWLLIVVLRDLLIFWVRVWFDVVLGYLFCVLLRWGVAFSVIWFFVCLCFVFVLVFVNSVVVCWFAVFVFYVYFINCYCWLFWCFVYWLGLLWLLLFVLFVFEWLLWFVIEWF